MSPLLPLLPLLPPPPFSVPPLHLSPPLIQTGARQKKNTHMANRNRQSEASYLLLAHEWGTVLEELLEAEKDSPQTGGTYRPQLCFTGAKFEEWYNGVYGVGDEEVGLKLPTAGETGTKLLRSGLFSKPGESSSSQAVFETTETEYAMDITAPPMPAAASKMHNNLPKDLPPPHPVATQSKESFFENICCIFKKPPPDASEREMEEHNFIKEGLMYFYPAAETERHVDHQVHLVSGVFTLVDIVSHITTKYSHPSDVTGSPVVKLGKSILVLAPLTDPARVVRTVYLILGAPENTAEAHIRFVADQFNKALVFILGPLEDLHERVSEARLDKAIADVAADVKNVLCAGGWGIPSIPYTPASTSALTYRLGGKCTNSTLGSYVRASSLLERILSKNENVLGVALFHEGVKGDGASACPAQVLAYEMAEDVLKLVRVCAAECLYGSPFQAHGVAATSASSSSSSSFSSFTLFSQQSAFTATSYVGLWMRLNNIRHAYKHKLSANEEVCCVPVYLSGEEDESSPFVSNHLFPRYMRKQGWYGLYMQRYGTVCCAMLVALGDLWDLGTAISSELSADMQALDATVRPTKEVDETDGRSFAIWSAADESVSASDAQDPQLLAECARIKYLNETLRGNASEDTPKFNRLLLYQADKQQYVSSRLFAGSQSFFFINAGSKTNSTPFSIPKIGNVEDIAKLHLGPFPCLI